MYPKRSEDYGNDAAVSRLPYLQEIFTLRHLALIPDQYRSNGVECNTNRVSLGTAEAIRAE